MATKIDFRLVVISLACLAAFGTGAFYLHNWQVQRQAGILLYRAQQAETDGDLAKAIDFYSRYLALTPKDSDAQVCYGTLLMKVGHSDMASPLFEAVLRRDNTKSDVRRQAVKAAMALNRFTDARDHLESYLLKEFPNDADLLELEGFCQARAGEYLPAVGSFVKSIARDPKRTAAYTQLIAIFSVPRKEFAKDRDQWLAVLPDELRNSLAQSKNWTDKAADYWANRLVAANAMDPQGYLERGYWRCRQQQFDGAIQDAQTALKLIQEAETALNLKSEDHDAQSDSAKAAVQQVLLKLRSEDHDALQLAAISCDAAEHVAVRSSATLLGLFPRDPGAMQIADCVSMAASALRQRAADYAKRGVLARPKDPRMYEFLAQLELDDQRSDEALKWYQKGVEECSSPKLWWELGSLLIAKGRFDEARQTAKNLREKDFATTESGTSTAQVGPKLYADFLDARIEEVQGHWLDATQRYGQIGLGLKSSPNLAKEAYFGLGNSYIQLADAERALKAYRQAVDADPMWVRAREAVAASLESLGRLDEAFEERTTMSKLKDATLVAWVNLARLSILRTSRLSTEQRDWSGATDLINQFSRLSPDSPAAQLLRVELLMAQDRVADAEKLVETEKTKRPTEVAFWIAEADLAIRGNHLERANQTLQAAEKRFGDLVSLRLSRAQYLVRKGEKAEQLRKLAENCAAFSKPEQVILWRNLASESLALKDYPQAERLFETVMAEMPGDLRVRLELFDLAAEAKDTKLMDVALDEIRRVESGGPIWNYAKALRLVFSDSSATGKPAAETGSPSTPDPIRQADMRQALDHLAQALRFRPNWPRAIMLEGMIYEDLHQEDAALSCYLEAARQGEINPDIARRGLRLLFAKGEFAAANALLKQLEGQQIPFTTDLFRDQSHVLGGLQDYSGALKAAQRVAASSKDYRDYLWLGQLFSILGQGDEAEKAFEQATLLNDKAPETWVAKVQFFVRRKDLAEKDRKDRAEKALATGRSKIPADSAPLAVAECLQLLGKMDEAGQQYALALKQKPDDPVVVRSVAIFYIGQRELPKAADQLARIVGGQVRATPQQVSNARGALARVRADQGGYPNLLEAVRLVDQNLVTNPSSIDDLRLKARLLAIHPELAKRREAMAIFEKLVEDPRNLPAEDRFRLAQVYLAASDWAKARRQLSTLMAAQGTQPQYVVAYAQALLDHDEDTDAETVINHLEQIAPDNFRTAELRAEVQFRAGHIDEVLATLEKFAATPPAGSASRVARTIEAASELETMGSRKTKVKLKDAAAVALENAERLYRKCVAEDPKMAPLLVNFLARQKRFNEALQLADEAWKTAELDRIVVGGQTFLSQLGMNSRQMERLTGILSAAIKKHANPIQLLVPMAELLDAQGKYGQAEELYREVLQKDEFSVVALNNLAGLLALTGQHPEEARNLIEKAITVAGPQPGLLETRASVFLALGQAEKARADMQEVIGFLAEGKAEKARADMPEVADQQPAARAYFHLALALWKLGRTSEAGESLRVARRRHMRAEMLHPLERSAYDELDHAFP